MANVTLTTTTTEVLKTVKLAWTDAQVVRITVKQPLPEYGLKSGQVVYLVRSDSLNKGYQSEGAWYYILTWNYARMEWECPCVWQGRNCRHVRMAKQACAERVVRCKSTAEKIVARIMNMPKLVVQQSHRYCTNCACALPLKQVNGQYLCSVCAEHTKEQAPLQVRNFKVVNGVPMR